MSVSTDIAASRGGTAVARPPVGAQGGGDVAPGARPAAVPVRPLGVRLLDICRAPIDQAIAAHSLVPNDPVLDMRGFAWTAPLRESWRPIRDEGLALSTIAANENVPGAGEGWLLWDRGEPVRPHLDRCPAAAAALARVDGLESAAFSLLAPGAHVPEHRGPTKGLITCHLGLVVPRDGDPRMRVERRVLRWAEGETLVFDDSYAHETWNESAGQRLLLVLRVRRPVRGIGRWLARLALGMIPGRRRRT